MDPKSLFSLSDHLEALSKEAIRLRFYSRRWTSSAFALGFLRVWATAMVPRVANRAGQL